MVLNPAGFQIVTDFGTPAILSGRAREAISGGQLVTLSGPAASAVSSGINSFDPATDLLFLESTCSGLDFVGVCLANAGSNESCSVATRGCYLVTSAGTTTAGRTVVNNGGHAVLHATTAGHVVGRALVTAGSEEYSIVQIGRS